MSHLLQSADMDPSSPHPDIDQPVGELAYVALGSNLGDRVAHLAKARAAIEALPGVSDVRFSIVEETEPIGPVGQGWYLNQMAAFRTTLTPHELLHALQAIEEADGRQRTVQWGPRTIDLDIVMFEHTECHDVDLIVPHPQIPNRGFWRRELAELGAPGFAAGSAYSAESSSL